MVRVICFSMFIDLVFDEIFDSRMAVDRDVDFRLRYILYILYIYIYYIYKYIYV